MAARAMRMPRTFLQRALNHTGFMRPGFGIYGGVKVSFGGEPSGGSVQRASTSATGAGPSASSLSPRSQGVN